MGAQLLAAPVCLLPLILLAACLATASPLARSRSNEPEQAATLVVTNDGTTVRNNSSPKPPPTQLIATSTKAHRQGKHAVDIGHWFREETSDYPDDQINRLLGKTPSVVKELYNVLNTQLDPHMNLTERVAFYNDDEEHDNLATTREESVCRTVTRNIYPREARRGQNELVYIPNNQEFMQVIQAEICHHPGGECNYLRDSLPYGMTSACHQKYAYKKLLYLDALEKRMASDLFRYPSCCACFVRNLPFDLRSANGNSTTSISAGTTALPKLFSSDMVTAIPAGNRQLDDDKQTSGAGDAAIPPASRSLTNQQNTRTSKQLRQSSNQTVILNANKVFEANK